MGQRARGGSLARAVTAQIAGVANRQRLAAAPVVADGRVYAIDVDAVVHAFSADNGATLWTRQIATGEKNEAARFGGGVSFEDRKSTRPNSSHSCASRMPASACTKKINKCKN